MLLIGESIHIISKEVNEAVRNRDPKVIEELTRIQDKAGANYIDLNLGPAKKDPEETTRWLVETIQKVTDLPISVDTLNPVAMEAGLKACKKRPLLNSASGKATAKANMLPLAKK
jgi:cobalamin-dependent methionine synthase I